MSQRALRRLRQEREPQFLVPGEEDSADSSDDEEDIIGANKSATNPFAVIDNDDDDESNDENEKETEEKGAEALPPNVHAKHSENAEANTQLADLDTLLENYKLDDENDKGDTGGTTADGELIGYYDIITFGMDRRDLDIERVIRTSLLGNYDIPVNTPSRRQRGSRQAPVFGYPRDNWPRPPRYMGGGMGMTSYDGDQSLLNRPLPWPYSGMENGDERCPPLSSWFKFTVSDSYQRDLEDFETVKASGDANALAMFVAHHPFVVEALLQLSVVLYQTGQHREGLAMLKRSLWVFENAALNTFLKVEGRSAQMDCDLEANKTFFESLFRWMRISYVSGLSRSALAASRFLLSLDPLRDPMNVLLAMDHFALLCNTSACDKWVIQIVESKKVNVFYRDDEHPDGFRCDILDMPNWSFSYALALFRIYQAEPDEDSKEKADKAIKSSLSNFPTIVGSLLLENDVDTCSRSMQTDWPAALEFVNELIRRFQDSVADVAISDPVIRACTLQAYENIARIFVIQNHLLWSSSAVLKWMYNNLQCLKDNHGGEHSMTSLSPAIIRYARCDPSDYQDTFQTMPAEANPLDPGAVAYAVNVDTNRPRFIQRGPRGRWNGPGGVADDATLAGTGANFAGPPTLNIDPDLPLLQVFWQSALPWAHVNGVPPPNL